MIQQIINYLTLNYIPMITGGVIVFIIITILLILDTLFKKRHSLLEIKSLIRQSNNHLHEAAKIQNKLYSVFNEIGNDLK